MPFCSWVATSRLSRAGFRSSSDITVFQAPTCDQLSPLTRLTWDLGQATLVGFCFGADAGLGGLHSKTPCNHSTGEFFLFFLDLPD